MDSTNSTNITNLTNSTNSTNLTDSDNDFINFVESIKNTYDCPICLETFLLNSHNLITTCCNHKYCKTCYDKINTCALCRTQFNKTQQQQPPLQQQQVIYMDYIFLSAEERRRFNNTRHEYLIEQINAIS